MRNVTPCHKSNIKKKYKYISMWRSRRNPRFSTTENGLISAAMKTQMSLVIAVALALDGGRDTTAFRVVCPFNIFVTCAAGFSRELWWFCMCFCIVLVLAAVYGIVFLQCLHIVSVLSVTLLPFLISTGKPKCCHINDLNVAGGSSILISPSRSIMLTSQLTTRQLFTSTRNLVAF